MPEVFAIEQSESVVLTMPGWAQAKSKDPYLYLILVSNDAGVV